MHRLSTSIILILLSLACTAQIVNIERKRLKVDSVGLYGNIYTNMAIQRTTKNLINVNTGGHLAYDFKNGEVLLIGELGFVKGEGENFSNDGFLHLRHMAKKTQFISWETFTQIQYNTLTKIDSRWLTGTGLRFQLTDYDNALFFWGITYMFEREQVLDPIGHNNHHRMSTYFSFTLTPQETVSFTSTTYIQPRIDLWSDYRLLTDNTLKLDITDRLSFRVSFKMTYDRNPPIDVPTLTYNMHNGLSYTFK